MTPSARLQAAIEILTGLEESNRPADRLLREWAGTHRFAGSKDRAAIAGRVFDVLRHRFSYAWRMQTEEPRGAVISSLIAEGLTLLEIENLFSGARYAPAVLTEDERKRVASPPGESPPLFMQGEFPAFLQEQLERAFGRNLLAEMQALASRAPIDLRVNSLRASRDDVLRGLAADGFEAQRTRYSPLGIRLPSALGLSALGRHSLFVAGAYEFQDEAAQIASLLAQARARERVLDLAAGAGGKSLALAAQMNNRGEIVACDVNGRRLAQLPPRAERAGISIIRTQLLSEGPPQGLFDLVFVDAPCSGTGIWRRQPELRSRLTLSRLSELTAVQDRLLDQAAQYVAPGGRIVYATCSILPCENEDRLTAFQSRAPHFRLLNAAAIWRATGSSEVLPNTDDFFRGSPYVTGTDGFFVGILSLQDD